ncbi:MAG: zf-TFIIB domain-containing protein [Chitinophagaceae bacterium]
MPLQGFYYFTDQQTRRKPGIKAARSHITDKTNIALLLSILLPLYSSERTLVTSRFKISNKMKCPNCNETLVMTERSNVEIDYCPQCRGVWLDKGELDKIIEQSKRYDSDSTGYAERENKRTEEDYRDRNHPKKKRGGFLGDLFDFD